MSGPQTVSGHARLSRYDKLAVGFIPTMVIPAELFPVRQECDGPHAESWSNREKAARHSANGMQFPYGHAAISTGTTRCHSTHMSFSNSFTA